MARPKPTEPRKTKTKVDHRKAQAPPGGATSKPAPKTSYTPPDEEVWSDATQAANDRFLGGDADHDRRGGR